MNTDNMYEASPLGEVSRLGPNTKPYDHDKSWIAITSYADGVYVSSRFMWDNLDHTLHQVLVFETMMFCDSFPNLHTSCERTNNIRYAYKDHELFVEQLEKELAATPGGLKLIEGKTVYYNEHYDRETILGLKE